MSLNNQIFSLRQAIIKAKRKAKQQTISSDEDNQSPLKNNLQKEHSQSQQSIDQHRQTKRVLKNKISPSKSPSINSHSKHTHANQRQSLEDQDNNSMNKISHLAKNLYSQRKKSLSNSKSNKKQLQNKQSNIKYSLNKSTIKQSPSKSPNKSLLTYSRSNVNYGIAQSRVSNITLNSQINKKSTFTSKLQRLRKVLPSDRQKQQDSKKQNQNNLNKMQDQKQLSMVSQNTMNKFADYDIQQNFDKIQYRSLFSNFYIQRNFNNKKNNKKSSNQKQLNKKFGRINNGQEMDQIQEQDIQDEIQLWKQIKSNLKKSYRIIA